MGGNRWKVIVAREEEVHGRVISIVNFLCVGCAGFLLKRVIKGGLTAFSAA